MNSFQATQGLAELLPLASMGFLAKLFESHITKSGGDCTRRTVQCKWGWCYKGQLVSLRTHSWDPHTSACKHRESHIPHEQPNIWGSFFFPSSSCLHSLEVLRYERQWKAVLGKNPFSTLATCVGRSMGNTKDKMAFTELLVKTTESSQALSQSWVRISHGQPRHGQSRAAHTPTAHSSSQLIWELSPGKEPPCPQRSTAQMWTSIHAEQMMSEHWAFCLNSVHALIVSHHLLYERKTYACIGTLNLQGE